jgi:photosystem II stability/assembly factor-like uncharacterized protein
MGSTGGGVWKTVNGGATWGPTTDGHLASAGVGAIAVAPSDVNVVWVGTGSACVRGNVSPGTGVYRSTDAGKAWSHVGLDDAGQIGRIRVHPQDPDVAWVAALGHAFGPNEQRGVFKTIDGGKSWNHVLAVSDGAGAVDLAIDPTNPRILFAAIYRMERKPWTAISGGEGSGLHRSADGGETWKDITEHLRGAKGPFGRIGVSVSGARPSRVYALVEASEGRGLYRSDDGGKTFRRINDDGNLIQRPWYYTHVFADPSDPETVWVANVGLWRSTDGGRTFDFVRAPHGDHHDLWIHPGDSSVVINGNDGGANVSYDGGRTWSTQANQPTAEMYRVTVDDRFPYHVYGCQQDNTCVAVPSRTAGGSIDRDDWYVIGGCESGHVAVDPRDPNVTYAGCYGGSLTRYDHETGHSREVMVWPQVAIGQAAKDLRYRFQWNAPVRISPHDPDTLYHASQQVHRSTDGGVSWETISPDLTRDDVSKQDYAGGDLTRDNTGVEVYGTVFAFEESPLEPGMLWAGTDDGRLHLSRDAGASWNEITPKGMPEWGTVNAIELSAHSPDRALIAVHRYRQDDFAPYVFRTDDAGKSWKRVTDGDNGIPDDHFVRVVREDPVRRALLYAGTEFGLYVSFDDGRHWRPLQRNLPVTPVTDLAVRHDDLIVATQGRGFWILDDLSALRQIDEPIVESTAHLFDPRPAVRFGSGGGFGGGSPGTGKNPPAGAILYWWLEEEPQDELRLEILDAEGNVLRELSSKTEEPRAPNPFLRYLPVPPEPRLLPAKAGLNRWAWNLRRADAHLVDDAILWGMARGPRVPPGSYRLRMSLGERAFERDLTVTADPRLPWTAEDWSEQYGLAVRTCELLDSAHDAVRSLRDVRAQVEDLVHRLEEVGDGDGLDAPASAVLDRLADLESRLTQPRSRAIQDVLNFPPGLDGQILGLLGTIDGSNAPPTSGARRRFEDLSGRLSAIRAELASVYVEELELFNRAVRAKDRPPVIVPQ